MRSLTAALAAAFVLASSAAFAACDGGTMAETVQPPKIAELPALPPEPSGS